MALGGERSTLKRKCEPTLVLRKSHSSGLNEMQSSRRLQKLKAVALLLMGMCSPPTKDHHGTAAVGTLNLSLLPSSSTGMGGLAREVYRSLCKGLGHPRQNHRVGKPGGLWLQLPANAGRQIIMLWEDFHTWGAGKGPAPPTY